MASTNDTIELFNLILNQNSFGELNADEIGKFINTAQIAKFKGFIEQIQGIDQRIQDALNPFYTNYVVQFNSLGVGSFPENYVIHDNSRSTLFINPDECGGVPVRQVNSISVLKGNEVANVEGGRINKPRIDSPYIQFTGKYQIEIWPKSIQRASFNYYRMPADFYWGRTYDSVNQVYVYDPLDPLNQELEWYPIDQNSVIIMALKIAGVNIREAELIEATKVLQEAKV